MFTEEALREAVSIPSANAWMFISVSAFADDSGDIQKGEFTSSVCANFV